MRSSGSCQGEGRPRVITFAAELSSYRLHRWQHCNVKVAAALLAITIAAKFSYECENCVHSVRRHPIDMLDIMAPPA